VGLNKGVRFGGGGGGGGKGSSGGRLMTVGRGRKAGEVIGLKK